MRDTTVIDSTNAEPESGRTRPFWPAWIWPLLVWLPLDSWHARLARDLPLLEPALPARLHPSPATLAWIGTAFVPVTALAEAGVYGMLWTARGRRLPLMAATGAILMSSTVELLALHVLDRVQGHASVWSACLVGPRAYVARGGTADAFTAAFGSTGVFTLARCALFAAFQVHLLPCRGREALAMTCGVWLVSHLSQWWLYELFQGRSLFR